MSEKKDLTGLRFMHLLVLEEAGKNKSGRTMWLCKCDCGKLHKTAGKYLLNGDTTSCGCRRKRILAETTKRQTTHKMSGSTIYAKWQSIKDRCNNPKNKEYSYYGERGITICKEWANSFENFYEWAISNGYADGLTIDRINNNGNYEPSNCRWVDMKTQANNTSRNHYLPYKGEIKTMAEWAAIVGISYSTLRARINSYNWPIEKAFETPIRKLNRNGG